MIMNDTSEEFIKILEDHIGIILKISRAYSHTYHDREDLINDITLELWKSFKNFKGGSKISTWMYRVALNTSLNYNRRRKRESTFSLSHPEGDLPWLTENDIYDQEESDILYECIRELNEINKVIILLYLEGNSYEEIALITGISITNVSTRISRIKEQLRNSAIKKQ